MTAAAPEHDPVRAFTAAMTNAARRHLDINYQTIRLIRAASEHHTPTELARIVCTGIGYHTPANAASLILYRLQREARIDDDQGATP